MPTVPKASIHITHLVQGDPVLNTIPVSFKEQSSVRDEIVDDLLLVIRLPPSVSLLELERQIPVVKGDPGSDPFGQQGIDELIVVCQAWLIDRIVLASKGFDPRPRDGEAVRIGSVELEELDVFMEKVVRIDGLVSIVLIF